MTDLQKYLYLSASATATLIALACIVFVLWYRQYDWKSTEMGRHMMRFTGVIGVTYALVSYFSWTDMLGHRPLTLTQRITLALVVYLITLVIVTRKLLLSYWTQKEWEFAVRKAAKGAAREAAGEGYPMIEPQRKSQPVLLWLSVLAAVDFIVGSAALTNLMSPDVVGFVSLVMTGINVGVGFYLRGQVVPFRDAAAYVADSGDVVAGPAASQPNGTHVTVEERQHDRH